MSVEITTKVFNEKTQADQSYQVDRIRPDASILVTLRQADQVFWEVDGGGVPNDMVDDAWFYVVSVRVP